ncbi:acetyl-CoA C-acetyltransferase [Stagnimonas aquatica]|uniref:Acetyl-CoA C-acetyltransferase n=1 Tax=Stagnimonas aquatica TaxID=2689987 RepID=A0A3N0VKT8_9GAMM|nr:acetyl-CoA C-acetyltransferase [Stagnimonas aquatica]ROH93320.1 acetyl-CoA C-acetyltransferase [Stagnimonas aquatica]
MKPYGRKVAIVGGSRIPFARSNGPYSHKSNQEMLTAAFKGVVDKFQLHGEQIGEVAAGAVLKHSRDFNLCRESVLSSGLSAHTPAYDVQMACGTGLQAAINIANKIALGQIESGIAGGTDTTSDAPIAVNDKLRKILLDANRAKTTGQKLAALAKFRPAMLAPATPTNGEPRTRMSMGQHCELMAKEWKIARADQDQLAYESHKKAAAAYDAGFFDDLIVPFGGLKRDNNMRADTTLEKLASLGPAYDKKSGQGTLTAGNSTPLTDGASAVLLASEDWCKARGVKPLAYLTHAQTSAVDFAGPGKEGLLIAPAYAVPQMLARAGIKLQDFDFYEIHEAFAAQVLCTLKAWESEDYCKNVLGLPGALGSIDRSKLNVKGGSLAAGHPFAATGGRIIASLAKIIDENKGGRGLISICAAGGLGVTAIVER